MTTSVSNNTNDPNYNPYSVVNGTGSGSSSSSSSGASASVDPNSAQAIQDRFLKLLTTQLTAQDPTNPMDNSQITSQMAQISSVTGLQNLNQSMGTGDNSNALQMAALQTKTLVDGTRNGTTTGLQSFQNAYVTAASVVGNATSSVKLSSSAADTNLQQTTVAKSNVSGVNLDQEAADLIRYQQAYQASSKVISIAQTLFQQILQLG